MFRRSCWGLIGAPQEGKPLGGHEAGRKNWGGRNLGGAYPQQDTDGVRETKRNEKKRKKANCTVPTAKGQWKEANSRSSMQEKETKKGKRQKPLTN